MSLTSTKRIRTSDIVNYDQRHGTSLLRELGMAVNLFTIRIPGYPIQFFRDLELYGIDEAKAYLLRYIEEKGIRVDGEQNLYGVIDSIKKVLS